jgi:peptide/nickel transport system substrate-binding protein
MKNKIALILSLLVITSMLLASCGGGATEEAPAENEAPAEQPAEPVAVSEYKEAPDLATQVAAGTLPPVEERLPDEPVVTVADYAEIGKYGGTLRSASWWPEVGNVQLYFAVEAPVKWKADLTGYEPGLVESYEWSEDGKTFTMNMRKGLKWSDGTPYTTADWKFWWEDFAKNPDQKLWGIPAYLRNADGTPITMEFPDDYTIVWKSTDRALWVDPYFMAQGFWEFAKNFMKPAHYLKEYHPAYTTSGKTWEDFANQDKWWQTPGYPCLFAWCLTDLSEDGQNYTFTRNPYYWRVDGEGNQLPYIDAVNVEIVSDEQTRILNCSQGKYDTAFRICGGPNEIPFLAENADSGDYRFLENYMNGAGAWPGYMVNQDYVEGGKNYENDTPEKATEIRELLRNDKFRQALSIGFDRQRVVDVAWGGIADIRNYTLSPQSWHFAGAQGQEVYNKWAQNYVDFDATAANALLDEIGMTKGADGFRTLPSGEPFEMVIDISDWGGSLKVQVDASEEMKKQWETNLAIKVKINNLQGQPDLDTRTNEGYYMLRGAHISEIDILTYPDWLFPIVNRYYFPLEGRWFAKGGTTCVPAADKPYDCGLEPTGPGKDLQDLYKKALQTNTEQGRHEVVWEAIQVHIDHGPFVIGVAGDQPMPIIVKNYMRNILDFGVVGPWAPATPGNQIAALWWMDK